MQEPMYAFYTNYIYVSLMGTISKYIYKIWVIYLKKDIYLYMAIYYTYIKIFIAILVIS